MEILLSRCDKCHIAYFAEEYKTTKVYYNRHLSGDKTIDLCDKCLDNLISTLAAFNDKSLLIPKEYNPSFQPSGE